MFTAHGWMNLLGAMFTASQDPFPYPNLTFCFSEMPQPHSTPTTPQPQPSPTPPQQHLLNLTVASALLEA